MRAAKREGSRWCACWRPQSAWASFQTMNESYWNSPVLSLQRSYCLQMPQWHRTSRHCLAGSTISRSTSVGSSHTAVKGPDHQTILFSRGAVKNIAHLLTSFFYKVQMQALKCFSVLAFENPQVSMTLVNGRLELSVAPTWFNWWTF